MTVETNQTGGIAAEAIRQYVERVQRLNEEIKLLNDDKADVFQQAKANGFDVKILKMVIKALEMKRPDRDERDQIFHLYMSALGEV